MQSGGGDAEATGARGVVADAASAASASIFAVTNASAVSASGCCKGLEGCDTLAPNYPDPVPALPQGALSTAP
jgi:hypothetical protein